MNFWEANGCSWHYRVHRDRLDETLFYYLVKVRTFDLTEIARNLDSLVAQRGLGGIRVFPVFGRYDLLIRAWLHPNSATRFPDWLDSSLGGCRELMTFAVTDVIHRWYDDNPDSERLESLDEEAIQAAQLGQDDDLLKGLIRDRVVITRVLPSGEPHTIKFYVAVRMTERTQIIESALLGDLKEFLLSKQEIKYPSLYRGYGFCSILVRGQVRPDSYFVIGGLLDWIVRTFRRYEANTETYLLIKPYHIAGNETIGTASLNQIRGRDLFVESVLPELYSTYIRSPNMEAVEELILKRLQPMRPSRDAKRLTHDYLLSYLANRPTEMAKSLFIFFSELESYLRDSLGKFLGLKVGKQMSTVYQEAGISKQSSKFLSLGESFRVYLTALRISGDLADYNDIGGDWHENLTSIRNIIMHGAVDLAQWDNIVLACVKHWPKLQRLVDIVEEVTGDTFVGTYWEKRQAGTTV